jgi:HlyD family secretion protein
MADPAARVTQIRADGAQPAKSAAKPADGAASAAVLSLLRLEGEARGAKSTAELAILIANETRQVLRARQIFVLAGTAAGGLRVTAGSGLAKVDPNVPLIQWIEKITARLGADAGLQSIREFVMQSYCDDDDETGRLYPFREAMWLPLKDKKGALFAGVLLLRETPWVSGEQVLADRLSQAFSQAWYWVATNNRLRPGFKITPVPAAISVVALAAVGLWPVSLTTLAPLEIAPRDAVVVTAPMDGVIDTIPVDANSTVAAGQSIVRFIDTNLRNRLAVAEREVQVADAKVRKILLLAVNDIRGRHELAIARAELTVKKAERDYARDLSGRADIKAPAGGLAMFGDKRDMIGKPVSVGEKIMEIADPARVELRVDVPVGDAIILKSGARVKVFLDSAPLSPLEATVVRADYQSRNHDGGVLAFRVTAALTDTAAPVPRLGIRGTAQLYGEQVSLAFYVLRRPIASLRQWIGY